MKKALIALALMSGAVSANAASVSGVPSYDLSSISTKFNVTNSSVQQFFEFGTTVSYYQTFALSFARGSGTTRFSIFQDTDGALNGNGTWSDSTAALFSFSLSSANTLQSITLASGTYILRLLGSNTAGASASVTLAAVPLPAAAWLFGSALVGVGALRRKNKNQMVA